MGGFEDLPAGWVVWSDDPDGRSVLTYRPDVFDSRAFPAACLPTLYVSRRAPDRRRPRGAAADDGWHVAFYLEPEVRVRERGGRFDSRAEAVDAAVEVARAFADGEVDYRAAYQVPREAYFEKLDELTGREP